MLIYTIYLHYYYLNIFLKSVLFYVLLLHIQNVEDGVFINITTELVYKTICMKNLIGILSIFHVQNRQFSDT